MADQFFKWSGVCFWTVVGFVFIPPFLTACVELVDYLRWIRHVYGEKASASKLIHHGWKRKGDFLPLGRRFTSVSIGRCEWHGVCDWRVACMDE